MGPPFLIGDRIAHIPRYEYLHEIIRSSMVRQFFIFIESLSFRGMRLMRLPASTAYFIKAKKTQQIRIWEQYNKMKQAPCLCFYLNTSSSPLPSITPHKLTILSTLCLSGSACQPLLQLRGKEVVEPRKTKPKKEHGPLIFFSWNGIPSRVMCPGSFFMPWRLPQDLKKDAGCAAPG